MSTYKFLLDRWHASAAAAGKFSGTNPYSGIDYSMAFSSLLITDSPTWQ